MSEYRILDNTVKPLVGHFQGVGQFPSKFVCDEELNMNTLQKATVKFKVGNINGRTNTVNSLPTDVDNDLNKWQKFRLGDNLDLFVYLTRTNAYYNSQAPQYNYKIGSLDSPLSLLWRCEAWSNNYNVGGDKIIKDVDLKASSNNEFYTLKHYQPQISGNACISWIAVYDNVVNKIYLCEPNNDDDLGILTDFKIASSYHLLNFIDDYDYNYPNLLDKNLDNEFLSIKARAEITDYVDYKEYSEYDDGNGSNPGQGQNDDNVGGDGNHDNTSDTTDSSDYYDEDNDSPFEPQVHNPDWNSGTPLYTLFKMSFSQVGNLIDYLCSNTWQSAVTNLGLGNVFGAIAKCITVPFDARSSVRGSTIKILGIDTGVGAIGVVNHLQTVNCGTITIDRYFGDFKDYAPYTKCFIYLPYIGVNEISINQVQGKALSLVYGVDLLDGSCVARLSADEKQLYSFSGNCATEYPIVGKTPSSPLAAATNILGDITGSDTLVATAGLLGSVLTGQNSSSAFQTVGGVAGNWGNVGVLTPFVYLERPVQSIPNAYDSSFGWTCNKYLKLDALTGYTEVDESIHLSTTATDEEKEMLKEILTSGFYINTI